MKRIIVPIDFSELSLSGLDLAILLAKQFKVRIELVHVLKILENKTTDAEEKIMRSNIEDSFSAIIDKYSKLNPDIEIGSIVKEGKIYKEVIKQAEAFDDSFIVTSTHGSSGWEELFTGSNAYKIAASSTRPIFTIRGKKIPSQIKTIVLPLDNTAETREKVPFTAKLAEEWGASIHIVTASTFKIDDIVEKLGDYALQVSGYLKKRGIKNDIARHISGSNNTDSIIDFALKKEADLISIMTEQENSLANILLGSSAHQMINKSPLPVLLFPTRQIGIISESFKTEGINY